MKPWTVGEFLAENANNSCLMGWAFRPRNLMKNRRICRLALIGAATHKGVLGTVRKFPETGGFSTLLGWAFRPRNLMRNRSPTRAARIGAATVRAISAAKKFAIRERFSTLSPRLARGATLRSALSDVRGKLTARSLKAIAHLSLRSCFCARRLHWATMGRR